MAVKDIMQLRGEIREEAYCDWYDKFLDEVTEREKEQCEADGYKCEDCPDLIAKQMKN